MLHVQKSVETAIVLSAGLRLLSGEYSVALQLRMGGQRVVFGLIRRALYATAA